MDAPLSVWYCDTCGEKIEKIESAYVIWKSDNGRNHFKIIHQRDCDQKDHDSSAPLKQFLGPVGLSYCMTFLTAGPIICNLVGSSEQPPIDRDELADFVRRVQLPHYEEARRLFHKRELLEDLSDWNEFAPYMPDELRSIVEKYSGDRDD